MWTILRSISDTLGVGFLSMQLIKFIGLVFALVGPLNFLASLFDGLFPLIASFFAINLGIKFNGFDVMAVSIAISGTLIVASSIATKQAMSTKYFWRFLMIPYAFLVIVFAICVQIMTPIAEMNSFNAACAEPTAEASFYGSKCEEMTEELAFFADFWGEPEDGEEGAAMAEDSEEDTDWTGASFIFALLYLIALLPMISVVIFFFKRLSVNRMLKRVMIAIGSALALAAASAGFAVATGQSTIDEVTDAWFGES